MKKFEINFKVEFNANCTIQAENKADAIEIFKNYLYAHGADLEPDACADKAKNIIDYSIDMHGTKELVNIN